MSEFEQRKIFKQNLNRLLLNTHLTQKEIADKIGVSPQTFNTWCQGKAIPRMGKIQKLADFFNVNKSDLVNEHIEDENNAYYLDPEVVELAQELHDNPGQRVLLDASRKLSKEDMEKVIQMVKIFTNND